MLAIIPGWNSSACDWEMLVPALARRGYEIYISGRRGQWGDPRKWDGIAPRTSPRGDIDTWRRWAEDYAAFTRWVAARHPFVPLIYGGQSMGLLDVITVAGDPSWGGAPARGVFVISPALAYTHPSASSRRLNFLARLFDQDFRLADMDYFRGKGARIMNDPALWDQWSLSHDRIREGFTLRWLNEQYEYGRAAVRAARGVRESVAMFYGGLDPMLSREHNLTAPGGKLRLARELSGATLTEVTYPQGNHALFTDEPPRGRFIVDLTAWLDATTSAQGTSDR